MMIFDNFPSREKAEDFAAAVKKNYNRECWVHDTQESSNAQDPFPYRLDPPVVLVERDYNHFTWEEEIAALVKQYGGTYAGT